MIMLAEEKSCECLVSVNMKSYGNVSKSPCSNNILTRLMINSDGLQLINDFTKISLTSHQVNGLHLIKFYTPLEVSSS